MKNERKKDLKTHLHFPRLRLNTALDQLEKYDRLGTKTWKGSGKNFIALSLTVLQI